MQSIPDDDLLQAYLDGTLAEADVAALDARLRSEPALADALIRLSREEAITREWASSSRAAEAVVRDAAPTVSRRSRILAIVAVAAAVAVTAVLIWELPGGKSPVGEAIALLEDVQGEVTIVAADGHSELAQSGQSLFAGQEIQTGQDDSSTVVRINDSRLRLASETRLRIPRDDPRSLFVAEGMVNAEVLSKPIVLRSSFAELRGGEGKFSFVSLPDATLIETEIGSGQLTRKSDGHTIEMKRGQFAAVKSDGKPLQSVALLSRVTDVKRSVAIGGGPVHGLAFNPDGTSFVTCTAEAIKRFRVDTGRLDSIIYAQKKRSIRSFASSDDGRLFALLSDERQVKLVDADSGAERWTHRENRRVAAVTLSPDGHTFAASWIGKEGNDVRLYDVNLGMERILHTGHTSAVIGLAYSPNGNVLATVGADRTIRLWESDLDPIRKKLPKLTNEPHSLAFAPDNRTLAVGDRKGGVSLFDVTTGSLRLTLGGHVRDVTALAFSPDGRLLASASADGTSRLWNVTTGAELASFKGHAGAVTSVAFSLDGRALATGGQDRKVLFWDAPLAPIIK